MKTRQALAIDILKAPGGLPGLSAPELDALSESERACLVAVLEDAPVTDEAALQSLVAKGLVTLSIS